VIQLLQRNFGFAWATGIVMFAAMVVFAAILELPIWDPESVVPGYLRMPGIVLIAILADVVPRVAWRARRSLRRLPSLWLAVWRERWPLSQLLFAVGGVSAWYLCYATFRNLKSMVPFINDRTYDAEMARLDHVLLLGHDPSVFTHHLFGTGIAAHVFSTVYTGWMLLIPASIAIALVWTRHTSAGSWYVTAVAFDWGLGALFYLLLPSVGPIYTHPERFSGLPETITSRLAADIWETRLAVLDDRFAAGTLQTIAAFPSLHVAIMVTICLIVEYVGLSRWIRIASWMFLLLTVIATVYFGWHYFIDTIAGAAVGSFAVWTAALATGNHDGLRPRLRRALAEVPRPRDEEGAPEPQGRSTRSDR
jgi:hypothetical protein